MDLHVTPRSCHTAHRLNQSRGELSLTKYCVIHGSASLVMWVTWAPFLRSVTPLKSPTYYLTGRRSWTQIIQSAVIICVNIMRNLAVVLTSNEWLTLTMKKIQYSVIFEEEICSILISDEEKHVFFLSDTWRRGAQLSDIADYLFPLLPAPVSGELSHLLPVTCWKGDPDFKSLVEHQQIPLYHTRWRIIALILGKVEEIHPCFYCTSNFCRCSSRDVTKR